ncbi:carotenoid oxygenase family protein [Ottowia sp.]|uniref:carotenoid oxygenase family protein n=1 Tax=Ottowia sp. TaxID=1898956 RepID=UPI0025E68762|nr:carotenoid oxygenase family protein [Ottowia sp.]
MQRRHVLQSLLATAGSAALGVRAATGASLDATAAAFAAAEPLHPWTLGYVGLQRDVEPLPMRLQGRLPDGLVGNFYRNGPARHMLGGQRYHHLFDGDGMVQQYALTPAGITHRGRFVRTEKFLADSAAGHPVRAAFGTNPPGADPLIAPDAINVANTSVLNHGGRFMALWEGGSATELDARTLDTRGPRVWSPDYAGMPFSAHPKIEPDGSLWNFGVSSSAGMLSIYRVKPDGELATATTIRVPDIAMVHDFAVTERHLVFLLPPLVFDRARAEAGETFLDSHVWKPELGLRVLLLPKDRLDAPRWFTLPAGFVFHIGNACEERGVIRLDCIRSPSAWAATTGLKELMRGQYEAPEHTSVALLELDLASGAARQQLLPHVAEFPRVDPRIVGRAYRQVFTAARVDAGDRPGFDAVMRLDVTSGAQQLYRYGPGVMVEEHIFVPRPGGSGHEGDGWLMGTALDLARRQMLLSVFDAQHLADGPLLQARMDRVMPLGLHAIFVPA